MLESPAAFANLRDALKANPGVHLKVRHEAEIFEQDMPQMHGILNFISYFVGTIMAVAVAVAVAVAGRGRDRRRGKFPLRLHRRSAS